MKRRHAIAAAAIGVALIVVPAGLAHNRAHVILPTGECIIVGSEKSVTLPDGTFLDLRPETPWNVADEIGAAFAADEGNSALQKGPC